MLFKCALALSQSPGDGGNNQLASGCHSRNLRPIPETESKNKQTKNALSTKDILTQFVNENQGWNGFRTGC